MLQKLSIAFFSVAYFCFVLYVPNNPSAYTLTVDIVSFTLSFTACVVLQSFLASQTQQTLLGGLCFQFFLSEEAAIIQIVTLSLLTNISHEGLTTGYAEYPEIVKFVTQSLPIGCCVCACLLLLSAARLVLIASPAHYQGINRKLCLRLSSAFIIFTIISEFFLNHVRCVLTISNDYRSTSTELTRIVLGISYPMSNQTAFNNTQKDESSDLECYEIPFPPIFLLLSSLLELVKFGIYLARLVKKAKQTAPTPKTSAKASIQLQLKKNTASIPKLTRSCSVGEIKVPTLTKRRLSLQTSSLQYSVQDSDGVTIYRIKFPSKETFSQKVDKTFKDPICQPKIPSQAIPKTFEDKVTKPFKDLLFRTSTITLVMGIAAFFVMIHFPLKYNSSIGNSPFTLLNSVIRIFSFVLPVLLVLFDEQVLCYVKTFLRF